jgi:putative flippase GtrA
MDIRLLAKFLITGFLNTGVTYLIYLALIARGLDFNLSLAIVYLIGILIGFYLNKFWTFAATSSHSKFRWYIVLTAIAFIANLTLLNIFVGLGLFNPKFGQLVSIGIITLLNYYAQKKWVFK